MGIRRVQFILFREESVGCVGNVGRFEKYP